MTLRLSDLRNYRYMPSGGFMAAQLAESAKQFKHWHGAWGEPKTPENLVMKHQCLKYLRYNVDMNNSDAYLTIPLTHNQFTKVSSHRHAELSKWSWHATWDSHTNGYYARRSELAIVDGRPRMLTIRMSRQILGLGAGDPRQADHVNLDTLDNTDENLRIATRGENACNKKLQSNNRSGYKGVRQATSSRNKYWRGKWVARIRANNKLVHLGCFDSPEQAHAAYCKAASKLHGEFARFK